MACSYLGSRTVALRGEEQPSMLERVVVPTPWTGGGGTGALPPAGRLGVIA